MNESHQRCSDCHGTGVILRRVSHANPNAVKVVCWRTQVNEKEKP